jgi:aspartate/methionine/tyrosine aminotransferase
MKNFTERVEGICDPPIVKFKAEAEKRIDYSKPVINLNQAVPSYPAPDEITRAIKEELSKSSYSFYTKDEGTDVLRLRIAEELFSMYKVNVTMENVCVTSGANNAFFSILPVIAESGDEIILLTPYYFNHFMSVKAFGITPVEIALESENNFSIPFEKIKKSITDKTRGIVFVNPSNPTGRSYSMDEVEKLYSICREKNIYLISDEVYTHFHDDYPEQGSVLRLDDFFSSKCVCINSFSKTYSITGLRSGYITASKDFIRQFIKIQDSNIICVSSLAQAASLAGIEKCSSWLDDKISLMREKKEIFLELFRKKESIFRILSSGSFFIYMNYEADIDSENLCYSLIEKENIIALPGSCFGSDQDRAIRLALGNVETEDIPFVVEKLTGFRI